MSIRHYCGEYLVCPAPIHMWLNWCSHACYYCFANLNRPSRRADYGAIRNFMKKFYDRKPGKDIAAWLALQGHPILSSNDSDPFAASNGEQNMELMRGMMDAGLRFTFQTRGGPGAMEMMQEHLPTMVYVSFTTDQEETRRHAEPGAPTLAERKELLLEAQRNGHFVVIGLNPYYAPWWDDVEGFLQWLASNGFRHIWMGEPHLNHMQVAAMPHRTQQRFAEENHFFMQTARTRGFALPPLRDMCSELGINTFIGSSSTHGKFWQPYFDLGYPFWPTLDGWFDYLREQSELPVAFTFEAFHQWADQTQGLTSSAFKEYLSGIGRSIRSLGFDQRANNMREVHEFLWRIHEFPTRMQHDDIFIGTQDGNIADDDAGRFVLVYAPGVVDPMQGRYDIDACKEIIGLE